MSQGGAKAGWSSHADQELRAAGHRSGGARAAVLEVLEQQDCCVTAQEIHDELRDEGRAIGLASVYRTVELLAGLGLVHRIGLGQAAAYEPALASGEHHHHAVCDRCGGVAAFEDAGLERALKRLEQRLDFEASGHDVVLHGLCAGCAR